MFFWDTVYLSMISDALACLHWLRVPVEFKIAVLTYKVIHGFAPGYLGPFTRVADLPSRRSLRSVDTNRLAVPTSRLSTVGSRAFPVAGRRHGLLDLLLTLPRLNFSSLVLNSNFLK